MDHLASDYLLLSGPLLHIGLIITSSSDNRDIIVPGRRLIFCDHQFHPSLQSLSTSPGSRSRAYCQLGLLYKTNLEWWNKCGIIYPACLGMPAAQTPPDPPQPWSGRIVSVLKLSRYLTHHRDKIRAQMFYQKDMDEIKFLFSPKSRLKR